MDRNSLEDDALRFLGAMAAANAHEIKNALAVINENAGLLEDLVQAAKGGRSLDLPRLERVAATIQQQVARTDHIAKSTHRFCQGAENGIEAADLDRSIVLVADMATRFTALREVRVDMAFCPGCTILPIRPLNLLNLLWRCQSGAIRAAGGGNNLRVAVARSHGHAGVRWSWPGTGHRELAEALKACPGMQALLRESCAELLVDADATALVLSFTLIKTRS